MVGNQIDAAFNEAAHAGAFDAHYAGIFPFPEPPVVHEDSLSVKFCRPVNEFQAGGNPGHNACYFLTSHDLQAVGGVVMVIFRV